MASAPAYGEAGGSRPGGKIVRARRAWSRKTPYERPEHSNLGTGENPSWISKFIFSPTRTIASGAGKLLSSVFVSDSSSSSSDSDSEEDVEDEVHDENRAFQETEGMKKNGTSEVVNLCRKDFPPEMKDSKRLIEQLLMLETFSRAERDKLFQIIESRVVEYRAIEGVVAGTMTETSNRVVDNDDAPAVCSTAILEAKKWLNEKRLGLGSIPTVKFDHGPCTLNSTTSIVVKEEEMGSPVDVAKSYMQARPSWASPSSNNFEFKSPSSLGLQLFKEETPYSFSGNPLSSSKIKRESPASGSWNIQEEIRRVRSKATEEMLRTRPSVARDWLSLASDYKSNLSSARSDYKMQLAVRSIDKSMNWPVYNTFTSNLQESITAQDVSENGASLLNTGSIIQQQDKDLETDPTTERKSSNSSLDEKECSTANEVTGLANGRPAIPSSSGEFAKIVEENNSSGHDHEAKGLPMEKPCELLSEMSMEVPNVNENDTIKAPSEGNDVKPGSQSNVATRKVPVHMRRGRRRN